MSTSLTQSPHRKITTGSPLVSAENNERRERTLFDRSEFNTVSNVAIESSSLSESFHSFNGTPSKITSGIYNNDEIPVITLAHESFPSLPTLPDISSPVGSDLVGCENESSFVSASDLTIDYGKSPKSSSPAVAQEIAALKNITIDIPVITDEENNIVKSSDLLPNLLNVTKNIEKNALSILDETQTLQREQSKATAKYTGDNSLSDIILSLQTVDINGSIAYEQEKQIEQANPQEATYCKLDVTQEIVTEEVFDSEGELSVENLDQTVRLNNTSVHAVEEEQYNLFKPQRQSTSLTLFKNQDNVDDELPPAGQLDISKPLLNIVDESETFTSATSEIFQDPESFDFFLAQSTKKPVRLRTESLYVKFDPLVENATMLSPQDKNEASNEEQNGRCEALENIGTPRRSSAIAAIDRLLFFSPFPGGAESKIDKHEEKKEIEQEALEGIDIDMCKELNIVRATVLQLEEELEKQKKEHEAELKRQSAMYQEKINKLRKQLAQEIEDKNQVTVVVEEYEKSISRLVAEKERARATFEQEKVKLNEDLQAANLHLNNTEAAFNDIHQKYERLKGVVSAYKINETVLKEGIQENVETIKALEARYDQLKQHATAQLEKSNADLDVIRKQHEAERISLHLLATRAEVKNNSVTELVEKVTRENQELAQILDEVIIRVDRHNVD